LIEGWQVEAIRSMVISSKKQCCLTSKPRSAHKRRCCRAGGETQVVTIAPVIEREGVHFAALGLPNMLNGGGAITACGLAPLQDLASGRRWLGSLLRLPGPGPRPEAGSERAGVNGSSLQQQKEARGDSSSGIAAVVLHRFSSKSSFISMSALLLPQCCPVKRCGARQVQDLFRVCCHLCCPAQC
jgi:hypothetical protein